MVSDLVRPWHPGHNHHLAGLHGWSGILRLAGRVGIQCVVKEQRPSLRRWTSINSLRYVQHDSLDVGTPLCLLLANVAGAILLSTPTINRSKKSRRFMKKHKPSLTTTDYFCFFRHYPQSWPITNHPEASCTILDHYYWPYLTLSSSTVIDHHQPSTRTITYHWFHNWFHHYKTRLSIFILGLVSSIVNINHHQPSLSIRKMIDNDHHQSLTLRNIS